jgi:hypothetical protein
MNFAQSVRVQQIAPKGQTECVRNVAEKGKVAERLHAQAERPLQDRKATRQELLVGMIERCNDDEDEYRGIAKEYGVAFEEY